MAYAIIDNCEKDMLCVDACPTNCIHPLKEEAEWESAPQLYVNSDECIDCGACVAVCPTNSIFVAEELPAGKEDFVGKNAAFYAK